MISLDVLSFMIDYWMVVLLIIYCVVYFLVDKLYKKILVGKFLETEGVVVYRYNNSQMGHDVTYEHHDYEYFRANNIGGTSPTGHRYTRSYITFVIEYKVNGNKYYCYAVSEVRDKNGVQIGEVVKVKYHKDDPLFWVVERIPYDYVK